jgi:hypothetical protein
MTDWVRTELKEWEERTVYEVYSRNLTVAVYRGRGEWVGIRQKFDSRFLFTEHSPPGAFGTVTRVGAVLGALPPDVRMTEMVGETYCQLCGTAAVWTPNEPGARVGTWSCAGGCASVRPSRIPNRPLFEFLEELEEGLHNARNTC